MGGVRTIMNKVISRQLRKNMTDAEKALWRHLRFNQLSYKFRRQCPVGSYIVDFVCFEKKLIIELDGGQHMDQVVYDSKRDTWLEQEGFQIIRFWNHEVLSNVESVKERISNILTPHLNPPPQGGRK
jgi:very-short-patch-repair endonuclease